MKELLLQGILGDQEGQDTLEWVAIAALIVLIAVKHVAASIKVEVVILVSVCKIFTKVPRLPLAHLSQICPLPHASKWLSHSYR